MPFKITSLDRGEFENLFRMSDQELAAARAMRVRVNEKPGFPCRISLADAEIGEEVILAHYEHLPVETPFRASHAVYLRPSAEQAYPEVNEVPEVFRARVLSLRGFSESGMLLGADLVEGRELGAGLEKIFEDPAVSFIHIHFAKPGCYGARADRA